jgi:hypothetical protein
MIGEAFIIKCGMIGEKRRREEIHCFQGSIKREFIQNMRRNLIIRNIGRL